MTSSVSDWLSAIGLGWATLMMPAGARTGTDAFAGRPLLTLSGGVAAGTGNNAGASAEPGEPRHLGDPAARSLWWQWTAPATGLVQVDTVGTTFNTRLSVYTGAQLAGLVRVAANFGSDASPNYESLVRFQALSGTTYAICVDGFTDRDTGATETGAIAVTVRQPGPGPRPGNDQFASAVRLPNAVTVTESGTVTGASVQAGEPDPEPTYSPLGPAQSVWYEWVPPVSGTYTVDLGVAGTASWEPVAAVYAGTTLSGLVLLDKAENPAFAPAESQVGRLVATFPAAAGQAIRLQVGAKAFFTSSGAFVFSIAPAVRPPQDDFADAGDAGAALVFAGAGSLRESTRQAGEPNHYAFLGRPTPLTSTSIWWKWSAPMTGPVTVDTRGSDGDTLLAVYRARSSPPTLAGLVLVGGGDDINTSREALGAVHTFTAEAGGIYYFAVTGYSRSSRVAFHLAAGPRRAPFAAWLVGYPALTGAAAAREADPDGDGLTNLQELLHGTHPLVPSHRSPSERLLLPTLFDDGTNLRLECGHANDNLIGLSDGEGGGGEPLEVVAQASTDLRTWNPVPGADVSFSTTFAFVRIPRGPPVARYLRLQVEDPNP